MIPSVEEVLYLHDRIIQRSGGSHGVRDVGLLKSALARPLASFGGKDLYPTVNLKAAAIVHSLLLNHPFVDGNKRTALAVMVYFLKNNGFKLKAGKKELVNFALWVENKKPDIKKIANWIKKHTIKRPQ